MTSYGAALTNQETDVVVLAPGPAVRTRPPGWPGPGSRSSRRPPDPGPAGRAGRRHLSRPGRRRVLSMLVLAVHAAVPVRRLREMICAYPAFHRAAGSALDNLAGQDGPYS